jgi:hypothetical protein
MNLSSHAMSADIQRPRVKFPWRYHPCVTVAYERLYSLPQHICEAWLPLAQMTTQLDGRAHRS